MSAPSSPNPMPEEAAVPPAADTAVPDQLEGLKNLNKVMNDVLWRLTEEEERVKQSTLETAKSKTRKSRIEANFQCKSFMSMKRNHSII